MLLLILGITWCVTSVLSFIPPWSPNCQHQTNIANACDYGNLTIALFSKQLKPKDCNSQVNVKEFQFPPVIHINSTNTTDRFTVFMMDLGPEGRGPQYLEWMVVNVSITSLPNIKTIPTNNVIASYQQPLLMHGAIHRTLIQILVFRHQNVLRAPFSELWVTRRRNFSFSTLFSNISPSLRMCGPVAATQYWVTDTDFTPSAPPAPIQPMNPVLVPMVPMVPVAQAPGSHPVPVPGSVPGSAPSSPHSHAASAPDQHQHVHTTFPKKSSGSVSHPMQLLFVPLVILTVMCL